MPRIVVDSIVLDVGIGVGFGAEVALDLITVSALVRADYFCIRKDSGEDSNLYLGQYTEESSSMGAYGFEFGKGTETIYDLNGEPVSVNEIEPRYNPVSMVGVSGYAWFIGGTLKIGFDKEYFLSQIIGR